MNINKDSSYQILQADIIRALAITFVVIFHFFEDFMPYGWLGVDIFYLLSGFLITHLIFKKNIKIFLFERLNRIILPLYLFLIFISILLIFFIKSTFWVESIFLPFITSIFGVPNFFFFNYQDYFNKINYQPNLHLWSLGLEVQFILLLGILHFIKRNKFIFFFSSIHNLFFFISNKFCYV